MSTSTEYDAEPAEVEVQVFCNNDAAELLIVDGVFRVVARGASPLEVRVPSGIYAIKATIGGQATERLERVVPGLGPRQLHIEPPEIDIPIANLATYDLPMTTMAPPTSELPCELFVCVRGLQGRRLKELAVLGPTGALLETDEVAPANEGPAAYYGLRQRVALERHTLRFDTGSDVSCISLSMAAGWCLAVFITARWKEDAAPAGPTAAIDDISILFKRLTPPVPFTIGDITLLESVRLAMRDRRGVVPKETLKGMLMGKFEKPMLGIYAAHILLSRIEPSRPKKTPVDVDPPASASRESDLLLAREVIRNVAALLRPSHPDVAALRWGYEQTTGQPALDDEATDWIPLLQSIEGPPLLVAGWDLLIDCANRQGLTDLTSLRVFQAAGNLALSDRLWLTFRPLVSPQPASAQGSANTSVPTEAPPPYGADKASDISNWLKTASQSVVARAVNAIASSALGPRIGLLRVDVNPEEIRTTQDAVAAFRRLTRKANWDLVQTAVNKMSPDRNDLPVWNAIQKDLLDALGRAVNDRGALTGVDQAWMDLFLKARRVPLSTLANALHGLDVAAVTADYFRKIKIPFVK